MHTSCNSPTRQDSYPSSPSQQSSASTEFSEEKGDTSSRTTPSSFKTPSKISKPHKRPRKTHLKILGPPSSHTTRAAHEAATSASPFLSLPGEIRNMIYTYALTSENQVLAYNRQHGGFDVAGIGAGLLQTCHMVSCETIHMPLLLNTLVFRPATGSGYKEKMMLNCLAKIIRLGREFGWRDELKIKVY